MLETLQTEIRNIRQLALDPTPVNYREIQAKLEATVACLGAALNDPDSISHEPASLRTFLKQLPFELLRLQRLMQAPLSFFKQLDAIRAMHFGAYAPTGELRSLEPKPHARTVMHL